jgi:hypothetical protein
MRGDYVRLQYEFSAVPRDRALGLPASEAGGRQLPPDLPVFASLTTNEEGLAELVSLGVERPQTGLFLRGRVEPNRGFWQNTIPVRYGIEAYFMEQGKALDLERTRQRGTVQIPLEMEVVVGLGGIGVLRSHRWSPLGIGLDLDRDTNALPATVRERLGRADAARILRARVYLMNTGTNDLTLVDLPGNESFALIAVAGGAEDWQWVGRERTQSPTPGDLILLRPGESHTNTIDLTAPDWFVVDRKATGPRRPQSLGEVAQGSSLGWTRFRFEYRAPAVAERAGLPAGRSIWPGHLATRAFTVAGWID